MTLTVWLQYNPYNTFTMTHTIHSLWLKHYDSFNMTHILSCIQYDSYSMTHTVWFVQYEFGMDSKWNRLIPSMSYAAFVFYSWLLSVPELKQICVERCEIDLLDCIMGCSDDVQCLSGCIRLETQCLDSKLEFSLLFMNEMRNDNQF